MNRFWVIALALLSVAALDARAQSQAQAEVADRQVSASPGRDKRVGLYTNIQPDCTSGPLPNIRLLVAPAHGNVTVKRGRLKGTNFKQCPAIEVPALIASYRAAGAFTGSDEFELEITLQEGRKQLQRFHVNVSSSTGGGQGI